MKTNVKKITAIILSAMLLLCSIPLISFAAEYEGECGENMRWSLSGGALEITGSGAMTEYEDSEDIPWNNYCENITKVVIADGVTTVSSKAFASCPNLTEAVIPTSLTELSPGMFAGCGFKEFTVPSTIEKIGRWAFSNCLHLESITLSDGIKEICGYAFLYCPIKTVTIPGSVKRIGGYFSEEEQEIVDIAPFQFCESLETVILEEGVEELGYAAFWDCPAIKNVVLPDTLKTVGMNAFGGCVELESLVIPASVEKFDMYAVCYCPKLKDIYYKGTQEQWNEIEIAEENEELKAIPVHYGYVTVDDILPEDGAIIRTPSTDTVKYGETLVLHSGIEALPDGMKIVWTAEGEGVTLIPSEDTLSCKVSCEKNGSFTVTATLVDEDGNVATDMYGNEIVSEQEIESKVNFIYKLISFIKNLFGFSRTILQAV